MVKLAGALALAVAVVILTAAPALAHAILLSSSPADGSVVKQSPTALELTFNESVEVSLGSIKLLDQKGNRVDIGSPHHSVSSDHTIEAGVPHLSDGLYVLSWRVISADAHPVHGGFFFTVGHSSVNGQAVANRLEAQSNGSRTVGVLFAIARAAIFAGIALLLGAVAFAGAIRPHGRRRSRADALMWVGWIVLLVSTVVALLLQGPYAEALSLSGMLHIAVVRAVLHTRYGHLVEIRLALLLAALPLLFALRRSFRPSAGWWALAVPVGLGIAATPGLAGHAATGTFTDFGIPLDTLHVAAMSVWLGGLASLALIGLDHDPDARRAADRFSPVALWSVAIIVASGVFASWREVGWSVAAFRHTSYGNILLAKIAVFIGLLALAAWSRHVVRARRPASLSAAVATERAATREGQSAPSDPEVRSLRISVFGELVFGITVLVITSLLVNAQPARSALALPFSTEIKQPTMLIDVIVAPAKAGPVVIHLYALTPSGGNEYLQDMTAEITLPSKGIGPLTIPLERAGPNHFRNTDFFVPFAGRWKLTVRAFHTQIDEVAAQTTVDIR